MMEVEKNGRLTQMHQILSFDIDQLPQANHKYNPTILSAGSLEAKLSNLPRAKVPVRDGRSQNQFLKEAAKKQKLVENADRIGYTAAEVKEHNKENDCWTIFRGKVYDITEYARVHPGGRKIFLGKGKDCTQLYEQYHPWVNAEALIGKYQVGVLKQE